jgi:selenocysteine-specific elongation factor
VGGMDAVLFVIAADEGIMPQTREHEAILRLLQISRGILILTKIDLAPDEEWVDYLKEEIRSLFSGSALADAPILGVSARTGEGMDALRAEIEQMVHSLPNKPDFQRPRLPVDRVFQLPGIGTVVTGTLLDGELRVGEQIEVLTSKKTGRIRELQIHHKKVQSVLPGNRTAVNISGISKDEIDRGDVIAWPDIYQPTKRLDIWVQLLKGIAKPLTHNSKVRLYLGSKAVSARVRVLGEPHLLGGESGFLQLECEEPVIAVKGDRLILRKFSPGETLGGGTVVNPHPIGRHKRFSETVLAELAMLHQEDPVALLEQLLEAQGAFTLTALSERLNFTHAQTEEIVENLHKRDILFQLTDGKPNQSTDPVWIHRKYWQAKREDLVGWLRAFHDQYPLKPGATLLQIRDRFTKEAQLLNPLIQSLLSDNQITLVQNQVYALPGFSIRLTTRQQRAWDSVSLALQKTPHTPPGLRDLAVLVGEEMLKSFLDGGLLLKVSDDLVYLPEQIQSYEDWLCNYFSTHELLPLGDFKEAFNTSRKFSQAVLEYFDRLHITERMEDGRKLYTKG